MPVAFPALKPTSRELTAPTWPITSARSQSGAVSRRKWGSNSTEPQLRLVFACSDAETDSIFAAYNTAKGSIDTLTLPPEIWHGMEGALLTRVTNYGSRLRWSFVADDPPALRSLICGRSEVTVRLVAELRA